MIVIVLMLFLLTFIILVLYASMHVVPAFAGLSWLRKILGVGISGLIGFMCWRLFGATAVCLTRMFLIGIFGVLVISLHSCIFMLIIIY